MEKYAILLGYFDKQIILIKKLHKEIIHLDISDHDKQFVFALKTQQFYTAAEDLFKQIAKAFENHIENMSNFHKEILIRMGTEVPKMRPAILSKNSLVFLDKIRAFRHFVRHAYDCAFSTQELKLIQEKLIHEYPHVEQDLQIFRSYIQKLASK